MHDKTTPVSDGYKLAHNIIPKLKSHLNPSKVTKKSQNLFKTKNDKKSTENEEEED